MDRLGLSAEDFGDVFFSDGMASGDRAYAESLYGASAYASRGKSGSSVEYGALGAGLDDDDPVSSLALGFLYAAVGTLVPLVVAAQSDWPQSALFNLVFVCAFLTALVAVLVHEEASRSGRMVGSVVTIIQAVVALVGMAVIVSDAASAGVLLNMLLVQAVASVVGVASALKRVTGSWYGHELDFR